MERSFNLVEEGFIPCIWPDGRREELALRDVLIRAHEIREVRHDSPLVTMALHRLLLAILHRNLGPSDLAAWGRVWAAGRFDAATLEPYFDRTRGRFDLCDPEHPFYQASQMEEAKEVSVWRLGLVQANNATLFDHRMEHEQPQIPPAEAARLLIAYQAFAIGGGVSKPFNFMHSPLVREGGFVVLAVGGNLFETLWLNALCYGGNRPMPRTKDDWPAWERDDLGQPRRAGTPIHGYLDYLTWQSRCVQLIPDGGEDITFSRMRMLQGHALPATSEALEPMAVYRSVSGAFRARSFREGRSLWRDSHTLFQQAADAVRPPLALLQLERLKAMGLVQSDRLFLIAAMGITTSQAKISFWRHETLPLPLAYLGDENLLAALGAAIEAAEAAASSLHRAVRRLAELASQPPQGGRADPDRVSQLADSLGCDSRYWARLERPFREFLLRLPGDTDHQQACCADWARLACAAARRVFQEAVAGLEPSPRVLRAVYQAGQRPGNWGALQSLNIGLRKITSKEPNHEPVTSQ